MSANERGLGRGLDALFRNVTPAERPSSAKADSAEVPAPSVPKNTTTLPIAALSKELVTAQKIADRAGWK